MAKSNPAQTSVKSGSTEASTVSDAASRERSFPHPFGSQEIQQARHAAILVMRNLLATEGATLADYVRMTRTAILILNGSGKAGLMGLMKAGKDYEMDLVEIPVIVEGLSDYKADWPSNVAQVRAFIKENAETISALGGKTEFDALK